MLLKVGGSYVTRGSHLVVIVDKVDDYYVDHLNRFYTSDGVPSSDGVESEYRIIGKV